MAQEKEYTNQYVIGKVRGRIRLPPVLVQFALLLAGVVITAIAVIFLNVFIQNMVKDEYERVTQSTVESLVGGLSQLELAVDTAANILSMSENVDRQILSRKVHEAVPGLTRFDQVLWVYQTEPGKWQFTNIQKGAQGEKSYSIYSINPDRALLSYITENKLISGREMKVVTDLNFVVQKPGDGSSGVSVKPFALIKPVKQDNAIAGLIIGVATATAILDDDWLWNSDLVSRVNIREVKTGYDIYNLNRRASKNEELTGLNQAYEFQFGNNQWEVRAEFVKEQKIYFLEATPLFLLIFGFIVTAFGTFYVRGSQAQSTEVMRIYKTLEEKNRQLEEEIAQRARLNQALINAERENNSIIDAVSDIIFETDTEGKILFLSARWRKVTGFDPEQSKGLELFKMLHPQDQELQRRDFQLMVRGQKQAYRSFTRLRTSDGTFRAVELAVSMIRQDENKNLRVVGTFTDVEERRRAERALSEAEKKYRAIVENAAGGIYQLTPEGLYLSANPAMARILGYEGPEQILRKIKNANETVYVNVRDRQNFLREIEIRGAINNFETQVFKKDGEKIWVNENVRAVKDEGGNTLYYEGSMEDITRRKEADMALREAKIHSDLANRAKSEFLANMSHELRTPLNAIIGFSEIIKNEIFGPVEQRAYWEYSKHIYDSGRKLLTVINEILDISKIEAGERQINESVVDLNKVVEGCLGLLSNKIESNHMVVSNAMIDAPHIVAEELAIKQILMNLLSNAIKFTPGGGRITIAYEIDKDKKLRLSVTDTGIGLDESEIEKALSPFGQIDNELSRSGSGTGLGLTLVDALVRLHGGELELFSQKGIGTTVTVVLPADRVTVKKSGAVEHKTREEA